MTIDYSKYSLEELLDVKENINAAKYPQRYQDLLAEIDNRANSPEEQLLEQKQVQSENELEDAYNSNYGYRLEYFEFEARGDEYKRALFLLAFLLINIVFLCWAVPQYHVAPLSEVHEFRTLVDEVKCKTETVYDEELDKTTRYYDLYLQSYPETFAALGISRALCQKIAKTISVSINGAEAQEQTEISLWHEQGLVYQIAHKNRIVLPYTYMKSKIYNLQTTNFKMNWFLLIGIWIICFPSFINAIFPGTFVKNKSINV